MVPIRKFYEKGMGCAFKVPVISVPNFYRSNFILRGRIKKIIDKNYEKYFPWEGNPNYMNFPILDDTKFFDKLYAKFLKTSQKMFDGFTIASNNSSKCWAYRGNCVDRGIRELKWWHNHSKSSTINAVYYLQVYDAGISFLGADNKVVDYLPKNDELIVFPSYLNHAAQPNTLQKYRYSVNMEILTDEPTSNLFSRVFKNGFS